MSKVLTIKGLGTGYRRTEPLHQALDLELDRGQCLLIAGPNGAGKSCLFHTLSGSIEPHAGRVELMGKALSDWSAQERAQRMALVMTERVFPGRFLTEEVVAMGRYPYTDWMGRQSEEDVRATQQAMQFCGIEALRGRDFSELSDGERQLTILARALAQQTELLLLDEPSSFLDPFNRRRIFDLLRRMCTDLDRTVLVVSHELEHALKTCDALLVLGRKGEKAYYTKAEIPDQDALAHYYQ